MFATRTSESEISTRDCPLRAAKGGRPYLSLSLGRSADSTVIFPAHDGDESATVNGYEVWDLKANNWRSYRGANGDAYTWEQCADRASPVKTDSVQGAPEPEPKKPAASRKRKSKRAGKGA